MVKGLDSFREHFRDYTDCYTVIGGAACEILRYEADRDFRTTKDMDIILILENCSPQFINVFWAYIKKGNYKCGWRNSDEVHFYRFTDPDPGYPVQIELFSRKPEYDLDPGTSIIPVHIDDDVSSLSAILLDDDFYQFMLEGDIS